MAIATQPLIVTPAHPLFAAEVSETDLTRPLDDATFERIAQAFDEYSVLIFHGQALTDEQQMASSERFDALVKAAEHFPLVSEGYARPHPQYVCAGMSLQRRLIMDLYRTGRELAGGAFQHLPSSEASFLSPETRAHTERYYQSTAASARDRVKLINLIWGFIGTE